MISAAYATAIVLISFRLFMFFFMVPIFFPKGTPVIGKVSLALIIAYMLVPSIDISSVNTINNSPTLIFNIVNEILAGVILGYITNAAFICTRYAGNMMDLQVGFAMMTMFDPSTNSNVTFLERILYWFSTIIFFLIDGHHMLIRALVESFNVIKLGVFFLNQAGIKHVINVFIQYFYISLKIAVPIVFVILITDLTLGLVARTVPQLNIMILGLPIKILVGLIAFTFALPLFLKVLNNNFSMLPDAIKGFYKTIPVLIIFASEEKTEEATPRKKMDARKKGQVAKSKELALAFTLLACTLVLVALGEYGANTLKETMAGFLNNYLNMELNYNNLNSLAMLTVLRIAKLFLPVALPVMLFGVAANYLQTGVLFTKEPLKPDFKKLNPINGFKRMFSLRTVMELFKDLTVITVVGIVGYKFLKDNYLKILNLGTLKPWYMITGLLSLAISIFFRITLIMLFIAVADYVYQRYQHNKDLKMTKQEVKEEYKQDEGDPQIKSKIKQKQREMAMQRMMQDVPKATVVVTNPTHISVALKYEKGDPAPKVVAKGADYVAIKIKDIAKNNEVPVIENKPLARLIYEKVEINSEVPQDMYEAVAEILAVVYTLENKK
ncbi:fused FliR family export protein/FlhB family type III secretion system protein [Clostridium botulinum]|nr:fused FliR family export protein/FlhB family type III secretion system protein [Clostridium botulinum]